MMLVTATLLEVLVAATFIAAGLFKVIDGTRFRRSLDQFGVPENVSSLGSRLIPFAEIAGGVLLLFPQTVMVGLIANGGMLLVFSSAVAYQLHRGKSPTCFCFGQFDSHPISRSTIARNILIASAVVTAMLIEMIDGPHGVFGWMRGLSRLDSVIVLAILFLGIVSAVQAIVLLALIQRYGALSKVVKSGDATPPEDEEAPEGLSIGERAPEFSLPSLDGPVTSLRDLRGSGKPIALVFAHTDCTHCKTLLSDVNEWQRELASSLTTVVIAGGDTQKYEEMARAHGVQNVLFQEDRAIGNLYGAPWVPAAVIVSPDGVIDSVTAFGPEPIRGLINWQTVSRQAAD